MGSTGDDHYFSASPAGPEKLRRIRVNLAGSEVEVTTAGGVFSPDHIDSGTAVLLANTPPPPPGGHLLDLGSGWGPIALSLAIFPPRDDLGRGRERAGARPGPTQRRGTRPQQRQRGAAPTMFPTTSRSARSARIPRSASASTSCTDCSSAGSPGWTSGRTRGSWCSAIWARTRCSAGWRPPSRRATACTARRRAAVSGCSRCDVTARRTTGEIALS